MMSICNAYASHSPLSAFAVSEDGSQYTEIIHGLPFQACQDLEDFPEKVGTVSFVVDKLQVVKGAFNASRIGANHGLEMVVYRNDVNSLKAKIHETVYNTADPKAYYLSVVNAYAGSRLLELHVKRGAMEEKLPLSIAKTYRLDREQFLQLKLTDGTQHLLTSFEPRRSRTYTVIATGVDMGLRGEPQAVGLVTHELGAWTTSEEMSDDTAAQAAPPGPPSPPVLFSDPAPTPEPAHLRGGVAAFLQQGFKILR
jgi:hypothetical protein